jgi:hypothetical protein
MAPVLPPAQPPEQSADETPAADPAAALAKPPAPQAPPASAPPQVPSPSESSPSVQSPSVPSKSVPSPSVQSPAHARLLPTPQARRGRRADPAHQQRAVAALFLSLLSLLGLLGLSNFQRGRYIVGFALVVGVLAVWFAMTAMARARRRNTALPRGCVVAAVIGVIGVLLSGLLLVGFAVFGPQATRYSQCLNGANTISAQQSCRQEFIRSIENATP